MLEDVVLPANSMMALPVELADRQDDRERSDGLFYPTIYGEEVGVFAACVDDSCEMVWSYNRSAVPVRWSKG